MDIGHHVLQYHTQNKRCRTHWEKSALANAILIRQPPEKFFVHLVCISGLKPKPANILLAFAGALSASMACNSA